MKKMQLQSFSLKLSELKEYELAKEERLNAKKRETPTANSNDSEITKPTKKTKNEVRERIGLNSI